MLLLLLPLLQFKPERWLEPNAATDPASGATRFVPFGIGPKACVAQQLAYVQLKVSPSIVGWCLGPFARDHHPSVLFVVLLSRYLLAVLSPSPPSTSLDAFQYLKSCEGQQVVPHGGLHARQLAYVQLKVGCSRSCYGSLTLKPGSLQCMS